MLERKKMLNVKFESCSSRPPWPSTLTFDISRFLLLLRNQKSPSTFHSFLSRSLKATVEDGRRFSNYSEGPERKKCQMSSLKVARQDHLGPRPWHLTFFFFPGLLRNSKISSHLPLIPEFEAQCLTWFRSHLERWSQPIERLGSYLKLLLRHEPARTSRAVLILRHVIRHRPQLSAETRDQWAT